MFTVTHEQIIILCLAFLGGFTIKILVNIFKMSKKVKENNQVVKEGKEKFQAIKDRGDFPEWIKMNVNSKIVRVCRESGYCPELECVIPQEYVNRHFENIKMEEEFNEFKNSRFAEIADVYGIDESIVADIYEESMKIKKDFSLKKMDKLIAELKKQGFNVLSEEKE